MIAFFRRCSLFSFRHTSHFIQPSRLQLLAYRTTQHLSTRYLKPYSWMSRKSGILLQLRSRRAFHSVTGPTNNTFYILQRSHNNYNPFTYISISLQRIFVILTKSPYLQHTLSYNTPVDICTLVRQKSLSPWRKRSTKTKTHRTAFKISQALRVS